MPDNESNLAKRSSSVAISDWMMTTFIIAGIVVTFWAVCICGLAICLLRVYYKRRKKEILIKKHVNNNNNHKKISIDHLEHNTNDLNINEDGEPSQK